MGASEYEQAWRLLEEAGWAHERGNMTTAQRLKNAAFSLYRAHATMNGKTGNPGRTGGTTLVPFGRSKGMPISSCTSKDLAWLRDAVTGSVNDPTKAKWRSSNEALVAAIQAELEERGEA